MTATAQLPPLQMETIEFQRLKTGLEASPTDSLVKNLGIVYVTSITRDGCSGCAEQKPLFRELAAKMNQKHHNLVQFTNVHIRYQPGDQRESWEAKRAFGHAAYPTYMVHVKSHMGPLEVYRSVYPAMEELEKQVTDALELAEYYETAASKAYLLHAGSVGQPRAAILVVWSSFSFLSGNRWNARVPTSNLGLHDACLLVPRMGL